MATNDVRKIQIQKGKQIQKPVWQEMGKIQIQKERHKLLQDAVGREEEIYLTNTKKNFCWITW